MQKIRASITAIGAYLPDYILDNTELEKMVDTNNEWILSRTGISERRILKGEGMGTSEMGAGAVRMLLEKRGITAEDIDLIICATTTPDHQFPATANIIADKVGIKNAFGFDINAACSGFVYGLVVAHGLIAMGSKKVLLIGTDTLSRITDWTDRNTAILFADGSGAAVIEATTGPTELLGWDLDADGSAEELLYAEIGGNIHMDGKEVFRRAVRIMVDSAQKSMQIAGVTADDIALIVPHQANTRIISAACDRLGIPMERTSTVLHETGNTSSASIPLALFDAADGGSMSGRTLHEGDLVLVVGFGAGMTAASAVLRWNGKGLRA